MRAIFLPVVSFLFMACPLLAERSVDGGEKQPLPQGFTVEELTRKHEIGTYVPATLPPPAGTRSPAEYEPMTGVLACWPRGVPFSLFDSISNQTKLWMVVASSDQASCQSQLTSNGVNMANVGYIIYETDSYWIRDFGPWFVMKPDGRQGIFDFAYNRPRPLDDAFPGTLGTAWNLPVYTSTLVHTGGNYMSAGHGQAMSTSMVYQENGYDTAWVKSQMLQYLGVNDYATMDDPQASYIDHIDCWAKILSPTKLLVLQVPPSHGDYANLEAAASYLATVPNFYGGTWEIYRVYSGGTEGYTNSFIVNDHVYVPVWNTANDAAALQVYRNALPGYHIVGNYYNSYQNTDAIHCRLMGVTDSAMLWISHIPVAAQQPAGQPVTVKSLIRCHPSFSLTSRQCFYRFGTSGGFDSLAMSPAGSDSFSASIPGATAGDTVEYYIGATDNSGRAEQQPRYAPATWCHRYVTTAAGVAHQPMVGPVLTTGSLRAAPNPAAGSTAISFQLDRRTGISLAVYDVAGRRVRSLLRGAAMPGHHSVRWDGRNDAGTQVSAGVYFIAFDGGNRTQRLRLVVVR
jgi:agmatine deiminase